jgi:hypothetical protein
LLAQMLQALQSLGVDIMTGWKVTAVESTAAAAAPAAAPSVDDQGNSDQQTPSSSDYSAAQQQPIAVSPDIAPYAVQLAPSGPYGSSTALPADLVLWTAGSKPASQSLQPFPVDGRGQLQTDSTLRVLQHSRVFALGDVSKGQPGNDGSSAAAAGGQGAVYPATAQVAFQQADYAAWNIWSAINGRPLLPFRWVGIWGEALCISCACAYCLRVRSSIIHRWHTTVVSELHNDAAYCTMLPLVSLACRAPPSQLQTTVPLVLSQFVTFVTFVTFKSIPSCHPAACPL